MVPMLAAGRANPSNLISSRWIDVAHQTTVLFCFDIPEMVATAKPKVANTVRELDFAAVAINDKNLAGAILRPSILRGMVIEHYAVACLPEKLRVLFARGQRAQISDFSAT